MGRLGLPLVAMAIGTAVTLLGAAGSYLAFHAGAESLSEILLWPNTVLQNLVPVVYGLPNIGTPDHPLYEGTPVNILAFFISFPLAILVYSIVAYIFLRWRKRSMQTTQQT
jgi:H+/gluconate symporter-like permease